MNPDDARNLQDRVILITGAAGSLGASAARLCARHGAHLILLDQSVAGLERLYDEIVALPGTDEPILHPMDLAGAQEQDYLALSAALENLYGRLDGLLHNAAYFTALAPLGDYDTAEWSRTLNVNLNAPWLLTRVLLPLLRCSVDASIVFTSDSDARRIRPYWGPYGIAKIAQEGMAGMLAQELASGGRIRVNTLVPGPIDSPLRQRAFPAEPRANRVAPQALDSLYLYLLGPASQGQTGLVFEFDQTTDTSHE